MAISTEIKRDELELVDMTLSSIDAKLALHKLAVSNSASTSADLQKASPSRRGSALSLPRMSAEALHVPRVIDIGQHSEAIQSNAERGYAGNMVRTAKYTAFSLVPVNLFEQFRRIANFYFLLVVLSQLVPGVNPVPIWTTATPLVLILMVTMVKDAMEDRVRHKEDYIANRAQYEVVFGDRTRLVRSAHVKVGDILKLERGQSVPADMVVLTTLNFDASCHTNTANLDGEVVPRLRVGALKEYNNEMHDPSALSQVYGQIQSQELNKSLDGFQGRMIISADGIGLKIKRRQIPLGDEHVLLRGAKINDDCAEVFAVVIACGIETKLMLNRSSANYKFTAFEVTLNRCVLFMLVSQIVLNIFMAVMSALSSSFDMLERGFLESVGVDFLVMFVLFSYMIPLSLYVTMELIKVGQALAMQSDLKLSVEDGSVWAYHGRRRMQVKASNINDELGQVKYVFSDKTGTLTKNKMELASMYVDGLEVANFEMLADEIDISRFSEDAVAMRDLMRSAFNDDLLGKTDAIASKRLTADWNRSRNFFINLLVCNEVVPKASIATDGHESAYSSSSPDEIAFVEACHRNGVTLLSSSHGVYRIMIGECGKVLEFRARGILRFSADRRRMGVVVADENGELTAYVKGADAIVMELVSRFSDVDMRRYEETVTALHQAAQAGSRTLVMASKHLSPDLAREWSNAYEAAALAVAGREQLIEEAFSIVEHDMDLLGCTAVDDQLQDEVKETVRALVCAGITVMVLTGDKQETAVTIGYASGILSDESVLMYVNTDSPVTCGDLLRKHRDSINPDFEHALVLGGTTMEICLEYHCDLFLHVLDKCKTIICSRATPGHKAGVVEMVKVKRRVVCLAIGDGANDVSMLLRASVGVGLTGKEGTQAAQSADFVLHRFSHLKRLLLVHGRYCYDRAAKTVLYSFFKNIVFCFPMFWYGFFSDFSGQALYDGLILSTFNMIFTSLPPLVIGIFEKDVLERSLMQHPKAYETFREDEKFTLKRFMKWCCAAVMQSIVIYFVAHFVYNSNDVVSSDGKVSGLWNLGLWICTATIIVINFTFLLCANNWTPLYCLSCGTGIFVFLVAIAIYDKLLSLSPDFYGITQKLFSPAQSYFYEFLMTILCVVPVSIYSWYLRVFRPSYAQTLRVKCPLNVASWSQQSDSFEPLEHECDDDHLARVSAQRRNQTAPSDFSYQRGCSVPNSAMSA